MFGYFLYEKKKKKTFISGIMLNNIQFVAD